jgi:hypothetical protein
MDKQESERSAQLAFITATKAVTALTYQLELVTDLLKRLYQKLAAAATKLEIAVDLSMEEDEDDGESAG